MRNLIKPTTFLIVLTLILTNCSKNYKEKLTGKVWANTNSHYKIEYLWTFTDSDMVNLNYVEGSKDYKFKYNLEGNNIEITRGKRKIDHIINFISDNEFTLKPKEKIAIERQSSD